MKSHIYTLSQKQRGGTLLGLIVGLVIGLAIAVAVALLITKSSTPFTNKGNKAADTPVTQIQDPNKPLYGNKDAVKEAAKDFAKDDAVKATEITANKASDNKPEGKSETKPDTKAPVVDKTAATTTTQEKTDAKPADAAAKPADAVDDKYVYYLQAGAFREQADAESARAKLALIGFEARISEKPSDTGNLYRVRIGPFNQIETMNRMRAKLSENSVDVAVVRTAK
ncbi:SPOR domain-containing protein [Undibacterium sp. Rencai35W]|uniref:SPOR domain-containing protein n=1 Tax=Undibacterium sp. Rencai35W TaxID=3413046 RepID=UPI003BF0B649